MRVSAKAGTLSCLGTAIKVSFVLKIALTHECFLIIQLTINPYKFYYFVGNWVFMTDIEEILQRLKEFNNERDWEQFHNAKDLSLAISIEAGELLELFLWKNPEEADKTKVEKELADIFAFAFLLANKYQLDVKQIILNKIEENNRKYPVEKSKGSAKKYNDFEA